MEGDPPSLSHAFANVLKIGACAYGLISFPIFFLKNLIGFVFITDINYINFHFINLNTSEILCF